MQKLNCILKIIFNSDELTPRVEKITTLHSLVSGKDTHTVFTQRQGKGMDV